MGLVAAGGASHTLESLRVVAGGGPRCLNLGALDQFLMVIFSTKLLNQEIVYCLLLRLTQCFPTFFLTWPLMSLQRSDMAH